jgi:hypothetical protein
LQVEEELAVANDIVREGNEELKNCLLQKNSTRKELQKAQCKIETGVKRRLELTEKQHDFTKRTKVKNTC